MNSTIQQILKLEVMFKELRSYLVNQLSELDSEEEFTFQNSFSDSLKRKTTHEESVILLCGLVPHVLPHFFDDIIKEVFPNGGDLPQLGGQRPEGYRGFLPTGETIQYILAKENVEKRLEIQELFSETHWFYKNHILSIEDVKTTEPKMSGKLILSPETVHLQLDLPNSLRWKFLSLENGFQTLALLLLQNRVNELFPDLKSIFRSS